MTNSLQPSIWAEPPVDAALAAEHGLQADEYQRMLAILGRTPTYTELGIFSAMWSEHCSYKSSKTWLKRLPTEGAQVIQGPGENAGVIDIGDGDAAVFKMESHNHPSFIEPYQGAATGVGGILRDVFTMGARPVANLNALRFGSPTHEKTRHLVAGVVAGIGDYGNCVGVPTVGGEVNFHPRYDGNILVNAMTVGLARRDRIFLSAAAGVGNPIIYVGAKTGRDGIHGATMASAEFSDDAEEKRPTVQVGDPFTEKLLIEACLELMARDAIIAIQDMGAAGLTSSSVEMASKGTVGIRLRLDPLPQRETGMTPYEIMLSESQERMLMVLRPEAEAEARAIFEKWALDFAIIGQVTDTGRLEVEMGGRLAAEIPVPPLVEQAPVYDRDIEPTPLPEPLAPDKIPDWTALKRTAASVLLRLIGSPNLASRRWVWEQYDSQVMADTVIGPGGDAALVRVHDSNKALALTVDCTPRYCEAHPATGGAQAVAEAWRNVTATGATPLAITDNMNFGNPERPKIMGQFAGCILGMAEACRTLGTPVVSGNVSLYNETNGRAILPTPTIGAVGLIEDVGRAVGIGLPGPGHALLLIGRSTGHLARSLYQLEITGDESGPPPPVDLAAERRNGDFVRAAILAGTLLACHDLSDGGLLIAAAEMALAGGIGCTLDLTGAPDLAALPRHAALYGEDQGRYLLVVPNEEHTALSERARDAGVPAAVIGSTGGDTLTVTGLLSISLEDLRRTSEAWMPALMA